MRAVLLLALCAVALANAALYPPISPKWGTYTWHYTDDNGDDFAGGKTYYDYVNGYVRMDAYNSSRPSPGINGVTIWDLREVQPVVWTIDDQAKCYVQKLDADVTAPLPPSFTNYTMKKVTYFNRALAEQWTDGWGGMVYVDVFSRDIVGMGNVSDVDQGSLWMNILQWSDKKPDGNAFLLPNTIPCKKLNITSGVWKRGAHEQQGRIACALCKAAIGVVLGKICGVAGALACNAIPFTVPFCSALKNAACNKGKDFGASAACKLVKKC